MKNLMNTYITITTLNLIGQDDRGATYDFTVRKNGSYILITRKAGTESGNTYHKGASEATNPKTFVLINGKVELSYRHINEEKHQVITIDHPAVITIQPLVTHAMKAITDITVLECNSIADIENDRFKEFVKS